MAKKELGSFTRTAGALVSGLVISKAFDHGLTVETAETILTNIDYILALLGLFTVQGWSILEKMKSKKVEKELKEIKQSVSVPEVKPKKEKRDDWKNLNR